MERVRSDRGVREERDAPPRFDYTRVKPRDQNVICRTDRGAFGMPVGDLEPYARLLNAAT